MHIFCQKNVHPLKNTVVSCHFFLIFYVKPPCFHAHIWSEKRPFCHTCPNMGPILGKKKISNILKLRSKLVYKKTIHGMLAENWKNFLSKKKKLQVSKSGVFLGDKIDISIGSRRFFWNFERSEVPSWYFVALSYKFIVQISQKIVK